MIRVFDQPHQAMRALFDTGAPVFLLVNPVEYHGPHLSLHNDHHVSVGLARALHARLQAHYSEWPMLLGADLEVGVEASPGPGTRATTYRTVRSLTTVAVERLVDLGVQRIIAMTFHGDPLHAAAIERALERARKRGVRAFNPMNILLHDSLAIDLEAMRPAVAHITPAALREATLQNLPMDLHGGFFETSLALHFAPETVAPTWKETPPCPAFQPPQKLLTLANLAAMAGRKQLAGELRMIAIFAGWHTLRPFPGYTGAPALATAEAGAVFAEHLVDRYCNAALAYFERNILPPGPLLPWLSLVTLGGTLR